MVEGDRMADEEGTPAPMFGADRCPVVLFDFDGTIADTAPAIKRVARKTLKRHGIEPKKKQLRHLVGPPLTDGFRDIFGVSQEEAEQLTAEYRELCKTEVRLKDYPPFEGMPELLRDLKAEGRRLGVASSRNEVSAIPMLEGLGLADCFETIVGGLDDERDTKAECIQEALERMDVQASDAVMVGDRFHDVEGAHAVGVPCIGIYTGTCEEGELEDAGADAVARSVPELREILGA